jgi:hypothetical protein
MPSNSFGSGLLVLVELGATWPRSIVESSPYASCRVLAELEGEGPEGFAARVTAATSSLFPRGVALEAVVLACNERADEGALAGRRKIARALIGRRTPARVLFSPPEHAREAFRRSLTGLVAQLGRMKEARGRGTPAQTAVLDPASLARVA